MEELLDAGPLSTWTANASYLDSAGAMDIQKWLGGLGLEQYMRPFADNDIDATMLSGLSDEDL